MGRNVHTMFFFADISGGHIMRVFVSTLPEIAAWVLILGGLGLIAGTCTLMVAMRRMLPWSKLHDLRQGRRGWLWVCVQWTWVLAWAVCLPTMGAGMGALTGAAFGARSLVLQEHVGQVVGERVLAPISTQLAHHLQKVCPQYGDLGTAELELKQVEHLLYQVTPELLDRTLLHLKLLDDRDPRVGAVEQAARGFTRKVIRYAAQSYFQHRIYFVTRLLAELEVRTAARGRRARLGDVVACACHLYFTPAFASWTFWWVLGHGALMGLTLVGVWLGPWAAFALFWWWRSRGRAQGGSKGEGHDRISAVSA
jgi:hypothetical protein